MTSRSLCRLFRLVVSWSRRWSTSRQTSRCHSCSRILELSYFVLILKDSWLWCCSMDGLVIFCRGVLEISFISELETSFWAVALRRFFDVLGGCLGSDLLRFTKTGGGFRGLSLAGTSSLESSWSDTGFWDFLHFLHFWHACPRSAQLKYLTKYVDKYTL